MSKDHGRHANHNTKASWAEGPNMPLPFIQHKNIFEMAAPVVIQAAIVPLNPDCCCKNDCLMNVPTMSQLDIHFTTKQRRDSNRRQQVAEYQAVGHRETTEATGCQTSTTKLELESSRWQVRNFKNRPRLSILKNYCDEKVL